MYTPLLSQLIHVMLQGGYLTNTFQTRVFLHATGLSNTGEVVPEETLYMGLY